MKKYLKRLSLIVVPIWLAIQVSGQSITSQVSTNFMLEAYNIRGRPIVNKDVINVEGTPLLYADWSKGTVYFRDGGVVQAIELKFNLEKNELYYNKSGELYLFNDPVLSFRINLKDDERTGESLFRSGYPIHGKFSKETFYEVIADGTKFQLVNYKFSYASDIYVYGSTGTKKKFTPGEELYIYDVTYGKMLKIKRSQSSIEEALPDLRNKIGQIAAVNKLKLKSDEDFKKLFELLNN
jgi:hypothetical protein